MSFVKSLFVLLAGCSLFLSTAQAQNLGLSFSMLFPEGAGLSTPVSPFSFESGITINKVIGLNAGFSWYRFSGLRAVDLPFEAEESMFKPFSSLYFPIYMSIIVPFNKGDQKLYISGGYFFAFNSKLNVDHGTMDRGLVEAWNWPVVNSNVTADGGGLATGPMAGAKWYHKVNKSFGITVRADYIFGSSDIGFSGTAQGVDENGVLTERPVDLPDATLNYRGLEISLGVVVAGG